MVVDVHRPLGQALDRLLEDPHRLTQLLHSHQVAVVYVAIRAHRHVEVVRLVVEIRKVLAYVVRHARRTHHRPGEAVVDRFIRRHHAEADATANPDAIPRNDAVDLGDGFREILDEGVQAVDPAVGYVGAHPTDTRKRRRQARTDPILEQLVHALTLL